VPLLYCPSYLRGLAFTGDNPAVERSRRGPVATTGTALCGAPQFSCFDACRGGQKRFFPNSLLGITIVVLLTAKQELLDWTRDFDSNVGTTAVHAALAKPSAKAVITQ
jgi:hypothetical protein